MKSLTTAIGLLLLAVNSYAIDVNKVSVQLQNFNFQNNKGSGVLQNLSLVTDWGVETNYVTPNATAAPTKFDLSREGATVKFGLAALNVTMKNANDLLTKLHSADIKNLNVELASGNVHQFGVASVDLSHDSTGEIHAESLAMTCQHKKGTGVSFSMLVDECLVKATAHADVFEIADAESFFLESFIGVPIQPESDVLQTIKDLDLEITKGDFDLSLKVKGIPLVKLKAFGNIKANMDNKRATIRIDKVKLGFVGVTDIVMKQLKKKLPAENFRVEPPFIYASW